ncbi:efflux RND transporter permease subunit [Kordiimonas sp. SCSIO 12610]|uniref:efflux RND transporter permease subunit n=1 Tax=Kordiimonas sp. SCSIO 12610 TaxID=2829597 RepID=UPI00210AE0E5|nr:efflux RND transporter permease subunit [Kordiimonas sp. SCSIO 12610]UTW54879.1 efflux RND transporter permease subunit [Kordiimonas sp. SCSIO 12610]
MNKLIEWWARNTVAANLLMIGLFLLGAISFFKMEREIEPTVRFPGLEIRVAWPGASPEDVEKQIIERIEESVRDLDNIDWVRSFASEGSANVVILALDDVDFVQFQNDVKVRVDSISSFPRDIEPPQVTQFINRNEYIRIAVSGDIGERNLKRLAEELRREVAVLPAISLVELFGVRREEVTIEVSEDALRRYNLTFSQVSDAIRASSLNLSSGALQTEAGQYTVAIRNQADTEAQFSKIIVRQTVDGATIRLSDVANIIDGFEDNEILATLNGQPAVLIQVLTTEYMNIVQASESVKEWITKRQDSLPEGVELTLWTDQAEAFNSRMTTIGESALYGLLLVVVVLLLTLRPKVAFWVTAGIAIAYAGAFFILPYVGVSINMLSTFAFLLVLGIVVDDAIVVGENIHSESQKTGGGITAAVLGAQLVAKPVVFAVLSTIIMFLPWLFLSGSTTEFTRNITWVVVSALTISLIESLLILPAHLSKMKPREKLNAFGRFQKRIADSIINFAQTKYRRIGTWAVNRRYLSMSIFFAVMFFGFGLFGSPFVKTGFFPEIESDQINVNVVMPEGTPYSRSLEVLKQLQDAEKALEQEVNARTGGEGKLIENWYTRSRRDSVLAIVKLAPPEVRDMSAKDASIRLRELMGEVPDAEEVSVDYTQSDGDPGFELSVRHPDLKVLQDAVNALETQMRTYEALYDIRNNLQGDSQEIRMTLKPGTEKLGLTLAQVSQQIRNAYFGLEVSRIPRSGQDVRVMVRYPKEARRSIESLKDFRVRTVDGNEVPLTAIADLEYAPGIKRIARWNGNRAARVSADMKDDVRDDIMKDLEENFFPTWEKQFPGVVRGSIGQAEGERRFFQELLQLNLIAFFVLYMMLAVAFKSYWQPILIMIAMPFAFVGAVFAHFAMDMTVGLFSFFGIAAAIGVVINDNLVLMDYYNRLRLRGMDAYEAVVESGVARFRPIMLTTVTTIIGLIPMMLEQSIQAAFLKPIVLALAAGVFIAFFVTLILVPSMCAAGADASAFFGRLKTRIFNRGNGYEVPSQAE